MPANQFSEFTFGFAFTQELTHFCWSALAGAPVMPSLFDEGHGKGFDVSLGLWGWTLFAQFKRGSLLTRSTALQWGSYNADYYRFDVYPSSRSSQHNDLLQLEAQTPLHWVAYVAPVFHTANQLSALFAARQVLDRVRMIRPSAIGALSDETHYVTYRNAADAPLVHSEPVSIKTIAAQTIRDSLRTTDWREQSREATAAEGPLADTPVRLDDDYFESVTYAMKRAASNGIGGFDSELDSMTSFGRARTVARLLFGAELLALPAAGQELD